MSDETLEELENSVLSLCQDNESIEELCASPADESYHEVLEDVLALCDTDSMCVNEEKDPTLHGLASWLNNKYTIHFHTNGHHCVPHCETPDSEEPEFFFLKTLDNPAKCDLVPVNESTPVKPECTDSHSRQVKMCKETPNFDKVKLLALNAIIENNCDAVEIPEECEYKFTIPSSDKGLITSCDHVQSTLQLVSSDSTVEEKNKNPTGPIAADYFEIDFPPSAENPLAGNILNNTSCTEAKDEVQCKSTVDEIQPSCTNGCSSDVILCEATKISGAVSVSLNGLTNNDYSDGKLPTFLTSSSCNVTSDYKRPVEGATHKKSVNNIQSHLTNLSGVACDPITQQSSIQLNLETNVDDAQHKLSAIKNIVLTNEKLPVESSISVGDCKDAVKVAAQESVVNPSILTDGTSGEKLCEVMTENCTNDQCLTSKGSRLNEVASGQVGQFATLPLGCGCSGGVQKNLVDCKHPYSSQINNKETCKPCGTVSIAATKHSCAVNDEPFGELSNCISANLRNIEISSYIESDKPCVVNVCGTLNGRKISDIFDGSNFFDTTASHTEVDGTNEQDEKDSNNNVYSSTGEEFLNKGELVIDSDKNGLGSCHSHKPDEFGVKSSINFCGDLTYEISQNAHSTKPSSPIDGQNCQIGELDNLTTPIVNVIKQKQNDLVSRDPPEQLPCETQHSVSESKAYIATHPYEYPGQNANCNSCSNITVADPNSLQINKNSTLTSGDSALFCPSAKLYTRESSPIGKHVTPLLLHTHSTKSKGDEQFLLPQLGFDSNQELTSIVSLPEPSVKRTELPETPTAATSTANSDFISDDPNENKDNCNPEWDVLRMLATDDARYRAVRKRWRNIMVPNPSVDLTSQMFRMCGIKVSGGIRATKGNSSLPTNRKRPASDVDLQSAAKRCKREVLCTEKYDSQLYRLEENFNDCTNRLMDVYCRQHFDLVKTIKSCRYNMEHSRYDRNAWRYVDRYRFACDSLANLEECHKRKLENANHEFQSATKKLKTARDEVYAFHAFYANLNNSANVNVDTTKLNPAVQNEMYECDNMYELYSRYYSN